MYPESELILNADGSVYHLALKPSEIANKIIFVGDPDRVALVSKYFDSIEVKKNKREFVIHSGSFQGKKLTVMSTGMGTDNIEIALTELDILANIDLNTRKEKNTHTTLEIVRIGTSGSLQDSVPVDTLLYSKTSTGLDALGAFYQIPQNTLQQTINLKISQATGLSLQPYTLQADNDLALRIAYDMVPGHTLTLPGFYVPQGRNLRVKGMNSAYIQNLSELRFEADHSLTNFEMETSGIYLMAQQLGHKAISLNAIVAHRIQHIFSKDADKTINNLILKVLQRY